MCSQTYRETSRGSRRYASRGIGPYRYEAGTSAGTSPSCITRSKYLFATPETCTHPHELLEYPVCTGTNQAATLLSNSLKRTPESFPPSPYDLADISVNELPLARECFSLILVLQLG